MASKVASFSLDPYVGLLGLVRIGKSHERGYLKLDATTFMWRDGGGQYRVRKLRPIVDKRVRAMMSGNPVFSVSDVDCMGTSAALAFLDSVT